MAYRQDKAWRRLCLVSSFVINLAILIYFKYANFFITNINTVLGHVGMSASVPVVDVLLPVGISFYTFQALSYSADVYKGKTDPERNFVLYALYVSFFPQLVAGPIEKSEALISQFRESHKWDFDRAREGGLLMLWGYFLMMVAVGVASIAHRYGVDYVNYLDSDVIDYYTDCYDLGGHLNPSGARKVTTDLGAYIQERYSIPDQRDNEAYDRWNEDDIDYLIYKAKLIDEQEELDNTLMLLADDDFTTTVTMRPDSQVYSDSKLGCLVQNTADCIINQDDITEEIHIRVTDNYYNTTVLDAGWVYYKGRFYKTQQ